MPISQWTLPIFRITLLGRTGYTFRSPDEIRVEFVELQERARRIQRDLIGVLRVSFAFWVISGPISYAETFLRFKRIRRHSVLLVSASTSMRGNLTKFFGDRTAAEVVS